MLESLESLIDSNTFSFDSSISIKIENKPVYEIELIALYKNSKNTIIGEK